MMKNTILLLDKERYLGGGGTEISGLVSKIAGCSKNLNKKAMQENI